MFLSSLSSIKMGVTGRVSPLRRSAVINRVAILLSFSVLLAGTLPTTAQRPTSNAALSTPLKMGRADANTFVGLVSDRHCGPRHKLRDKSAEECTRTCQRAGASYVLVAGEKIYHLTGNTNDVGLLAGQKAKITGTLQGNTITVNGIGPTE